MWIDLESLEAKIYITLSSGLSNVSIVLFVYFSTQTDLD